MEHIYFDRDLSWLSFNERVLLEAAKDDLPLLERINFLSIYSSNLDEFYRVRIPALMALQKIKKEKRKDAGDVSLLLEEITKKIKCQQEKFGNIFSNQVLPLLAENNIHLVYKTAIPPDIRAATRDYFFSQLLAFLQPVTLSKDSVNFFPENNKLYLVVSLKENEKEKIVILNIPSDSLPRFFSKNLDGTQYIVFIDDILRDNLSVIFPDAEEKGAYSFKITRDAELDLQDEYEGDIAEKIEKQIAKRDYGFATRFLYDPGMPETVLNELVNQFNLSNASVIQGGVYHNLKDLSSFPVKSASLSYEKWISSRKPLSRENLLSSMEQEDIVLHTPYQDYELVLRFFNEASIDADVDEIYVTLYRIAGDSRIAQALISAAKNGKTVTVFVELKARFDEANNIRWAKRMKAAGVKIIYSIPGLKVHAKIALVKKKKGSRITYYGLLATGNFNESTARFYTDHILLTTHKEMMRELELLFIWLAKRKRPDEENMISFQHLLVAQFNLQQAFLEKIDREIEHAKNGRPALITIKLNNLEEKVLIDKLYEASNAGVEIRLLARSICRLVPGVKGQSENIRIKRIVDRYLEHGRVIIFQNNGQEEIYAGSADWMNRNIYRRIEVCFPVHHESIKKELKQIINLQWKDNVQAVWIDEKLNNQPVQINDRPHRSQFEIFSLLKER